DITLEYLDALRDRRSRLGEREPRIEDALPGLGSLHDLLNVDQAGIAAGEARAVRISGDRSRRSIEVLDTTRRQRRVVTRRSHEGEGFALLLERHREPDHTGRTRDQRQFRFQHDAERSLAADEPVD